jgi:hypothetical protein
MDPYKRANHYSIGRIPNGPWLVIDEKQHLIASCPAERHARAFVALLNGKTSEAAEILNRREEHRGRLNADRT